MITSENIIKLDELKSLVSRPDPVSADRAQKHWDNVSKPIDSLGVFEEQIKSIAACTGNDRVEIDPARLIVMCADNGIVARGVTQTGQDITAVVAREIAAGRGNVSRMAKAAGINVEVVNIGIAAEMDPASIEENGDEPGESVAEDESFQYTDICIRRGTRDFLDEPAMTEDEVIKAIEAGIGCVKAASERGEKLLLLGEMGIGNTTTSSAIAAALLGMSADEVTGRGAGLSDEGLMTKKKVIEQGLRLYGYMSEDSGDNGTVEAVTGRNEVFELLCRLGGLDIAGLTGVILGASIYRIPVILDGVITAVAALVAKRLFSGCEEYLIGSHSGKEPAMRAVLDELGIKAPIEAGLALGEGSGAVMEYELLKSALTVYNGATFSEMNIANYSRFGSDDQDIRG